MTVQMDPLYFARSPERVTVQTGDSSDGFRSPDQDMEALRHTLFPGT